MIEDAENCFHHPCHSLTATTPTIPPSHKYFQISSAPQHPPPTPNTHTIPPDSSLASSLCLGCWQPSLVNTNLYGVLFLQSLYSKEHRATTLYRYLSSPPTPPGHTSDFRLFYCMSYSLGILHIPFDIPPTLTLWKQHLEVNKSLPNG